MMQDYRMVNTNVKVYNCIHKVQQYPFISSINLVYITSVT
jgi:hypothetical protein